MYARVPGVERLRVCDVIMDFSTYIISLVKVKGSRDRGIMNIQSPPIFPRTGCSDKDCGQA